MALFPSEAWCREAVALAEGDPEAESASAGWVGDVCVVMLPEPPHLPEGFAVYVKPEGGKVVDLRVLDDLDEAEELGAAYLAVASFKVWKALLQGQLDPVEAVLRRQVHVQGDVQPLIERAHHKGLLERVLARVPTEFVDEAKR